ncbi:MAG: M23 family metallopeptidase [Actinobacteria bacterium]|nr:M23 family metallopeptidase [Actinomycetota bacterium]
MSPQNRSRAALVSVAIPAIGVLLALPLSPDAPTAATVAAGTGAAAAEEPLTQPTGSHPVPVADPSAVVNTDHAPPPPDAVPADAAAVDPHVEPAQPEAPYPVGPSRLFATFQELHLWTPSADPVLIGFHEAYYDGALAMLPMGQATALDNPRFPGTPDRATGQPYAVLSSRGRRPEPTSAADIVVRPGEPVRAVVTGTVIEARPYLLYGKYPDGRVAIRSAERPDLVVTMLHISGLQVHVGQQVNAGETIVAAHGTQFPFVSHIDNYLGGNPNPHVHVEVAHRG